ncbi:hypothetical protein [Nocardioides sp.]|uniref:hypothetical protein n=1 Tax=Nocardioides sp. TaxID=35761 RepID=UPI0035135491
MLAFGLLLIALGVVLALGGAFFTDSVTVSFYGIDINGSVVFLLGAIAAALILWGLSISKFGAKREWRQRRDQKRLEELSRKLGRVEAERELDADPDLRS